MAIDWELVRDEVTGAGEWPCGRKNAESNVCFVCGATEYVNDCPMETLRRSFDRDWVMMYLREREARRNA